MKSKLKWLCLFPLLLILLGNTDGCHEHATRAYQEKINNTDDLIGKQPGTSLKFSMDRYLLNQRNVRFNDPNKMNYLYVVAPDGTWLQVTIIGKLASTSKRLTDASNGSVPDEMGTYGSSEPSKLGMSTLGSLLEFGGFVGFIYSEVPLTFKNMNKQIVEVNVQLTDQERKTLLEQVEQLKKEARR